MALGIYGVSNSTSTLNASTIKLLGDYRNFVEISLVGEYLGATPVFDSIFGIKYIMTENVSLMSSLYEKKSQVGSVFIYENPYAMSIAAGVNEALASFDETQYKSPFERMNDTVAAMLGRGGWSQDIQAAQAVLDYQHDELHSELHIRPYKIHQELGQRYFLRNTFV